MSPNNLSAYNSDQDFKGRIWHGDHLDRRTFEECTFTNCDLSGSHLHGSRFINCTFHSCDLTNALVGQTSFVNVDFNDSRLIGINFSVADPLLFKITCRSCKLDYASFIGFTLKGSSFRSCTLRGGDFRTADLREVDLIECDWAEADFEHTDLRGLDLSHEVNFMVNPSMNKVSGLKLSRYQVDGILNHWGIKIID